MLPAFPTPSLQSRSVNNVIDKYFLNKIYFRYAIPQLWAWWIEDRWDCPDLHMALAAILFLMADTPWSEKPHVELFSHSETFLLFKRPGSFKKINRRKCTVFKGLSIDITHTSLPCHFTVHTCKQQTFLYLDMFLMTQAFWEEYLEWLFLLEVRPHHIQ